MKVNSNQHIKALEKAMQYSQYPVELRVVDDCTDDRPRRLAHAGHYIKYPHAQLVSLEICDQNVMQHDLISLATYHQTLKISKYNCCLFNRPGVARAVLQSPSSLIN